MTIQTQSSRNDYTGNGCTSVYAYTNKIFDDSDLAVYVSNSLLTLTADYTVSGAGTATGGSVTFRTAPSCNAAIAIVSNIPYTQVEEIPENGPFPAETFNTMVDKLTKLVQQVKGLATSTLRFMTGSPFAAAGLTLDEPSASKYLRIKSDCSGIEMVALQNCGTYVNPITTKGDLVQGNDVDQERLALGTMGYVATSGPLAKVVWAPEGSVLLTNKIDAQADPGRFYALSEHCDSAFVVSDSAQSFSGCARVGVVTATAVGDDCRGLVLWSGGPVTMVAQGNIARGQWVRKGSNVGAVITTCVYHTEFRPVPRGSIGLAVAHSSGGCVAILKFPIPASGMQDFMAVRGNQSVSVAATPCTQVTLVAQTLKMTDSCNDVVVVRQPSNVTVNLCTAWSNKKNGRDGTESGNGLQPGDVHFYWVYEGASGTVGGRVSAKGPDTSGPTLEACETHWTYSHSAYWDGNCLRRHTVRGNNVWFDCVMMTGTCAVWASVATCETRVNLNTIVPAVASNIHLQARIFRIGGTGGETYLGHRLTCISRVMVVRSDNASFETTEQEITLPNVNQEIYYRSSAATQEVSLTVLGYTVPNGDT